MNNNKLWLVAAGLISVVVLLLGWFLGVSPKLDEVSAAETQRANVDAQNAVFQRTVDELVKESAQQDKLKKELKELQVELPPGAFLPDFLGQLHQLEGSSGVQLASFTPGSGQPFVAVPNGTNTTVSPLVTKDNFIVIPIDLKVTGTRSQVLDFVHALQTGKRLFLVNSLTVQSGTGEEDGYTGTISGFVYVLVDPSAPPPVVTPPAAVEVTPTPTPSP